LFHGKRRRRDARNPVRNGFVRDSVFAGNFYAGISPANVPWPGGIVPYAFSNTRVSAQTITYLNGLREWETGGKREVRPAYQPDALDPLHLQHQLP